MTKETDKNNNVYALKMLSDAYSDEYIPYMLRFDSKVLLKSLMSKIPVIIIFSAILALLCAHFIKPDWTSVCKIIKKEIEMNQDLNFPFKNQRLQFNTIPYKIQNYHVMHQLKEKFYLKLSEKQLLSLVHVKPVEDEIISIEISHKDKEKSVIIVNELANIFIRSNIAEIKEYFNSILKFYENRKSDLLNKKRYFEKKLGNLVTDKESNSSNEDYFEITQQLKNIKDTIFTVEKTINKVKSLIKSGISDFQVLEYANMSMANNISKPAVFLAVGFFSFMLCISLIIFYELTRQTIKSKYDFDTILNIKLLAKFLRFDKKTALKGSFRKRLNNNLHLIVDHMHQIKDKYPKIITFGGDRAKTGKTYIIKNILPILNSEKEKVLYIKSKLNNKDKYSINDYFYNHEDSHCEFKKVNEFLDECTFLINDSVYEKHLPKGVINDLLKKQTEYKYIIWELFNPTLNIQLYTNIIMSSHSFILITKFKKSKRSYSLNLIEFLKEKNYNNIIGVLNFVDRKYY